MVGKGPHPTAQDLYLSLKPVRMVGTGLHQMAQDLSLTIEPVRMVGTSLHQIRSTCLSHRTKPVLVVETVPH